MIPIYYVSPYHQDYIVGKLPSRKFSQGRLLDTDIYFISVVSENLLFLLQNGYFFGIVYHRIIAIAEHKSSMLKEIITSSPKLVPVIGDNPQSVKRNDMISAETYTTDELKLAKYRTPSSSKKNVTDNTYPFWHKKGDHVRIIGVPG